MLTCSRTAQVTLCIFCRIMSLLHNYRGSGGPRCGGMSRILARRVPVAAQTTVTSNGRTGPTACAGTTSEVKPSGLSFTSLNSFTQSQAVVRAESTNMYNWLTARAGDGAPSGFPTYVKVYYTAMGTAVGDAQIIATYRSGYQRLTQPFNFTFTGLSPKTPYAAVIYTTANGFGEVSPIQRFCFMTGGTYTMTVAPGTQHQNSGCFSISPLTLQDVRNCWCGRKTTLPRWTSTQDNTNWLNKWGCR